ncbi:MAG: TlpA family protein disulfide reductase [Candidatus Eremiobacteraeota bacterium]|nr:TlpA family protein disulfide reductase [Candidatus Eremiobacteraeota bacterium]
MLRIQFLAALGSAVAATTVPSPLPTVPSNPWEQCDADIGLPYDRPLLMKMRSLDGPDFDLAKYRGQSLVINLFATWCGPCNQEMPAIVEAAQDYRDRALAVIAINDREQDDTVREFRKKYAIDFPIAMDETGRMFYAIEHGQQLEAKSLVFPATMFVDAGGYLYCYVTGSMSRQELRYRIDHLLAESARISQPPSPSPSPARRSKCFV